VVVVEIEDLLSHELYEYTKDEGCYKGDDPESHSDSVVGSFADRQTPELCQRVHCVAGMW
jgi:hypothetical protein